MWLPHDDVGAGPGVVLLQAGVADRTMWAEHLEPIAAAGLSRRRNRPARLRGGPPLRDECPWTDVIETIDQLRIDRPVLVGNSFGGAVAMRVAVLVPERTRALVLISAPPPVLEPSDRLEAAWKAEESALERGDVEGAVAAVINVWTLPDAPQTLRERVAQMQRRAFELQAADEPAACPDPVEGDPDALGTLGSPRW